MENIVNLNEDEIFKTLQICQILKGNHMGVLCIGTFNTEAYMRLKQFSNTIHTLVATAYKNNIPLVGYEYYGNVPSEYVLKDILTEEMPEYKVIKSKRTIRKESSFLPMLNFLYPKLNIGEMNLGNGFTYSEPYVKYNGNIVCIWKPLHQEVVSEKNFSFENKSLIYTYKKPIYILTADAKRHLATEFEETFIINLISKRITRECNYINTSSHFVNGRYIFDNGLWKAVKQTSQIIMGSKTQISGAKMVV